MLDGEAAGGFEIPAAGADRGASAAGVAAKPPPPPPPPPPHSAGAGKRDGNGVRRRRSGSGGESRFAGAAHGVRDAPAPPGTDDQQAAAGEVAPEEVPVMPRFDALAGRFRDFHRSRGGRSESTPLSGGGGGGSRRRGEGGGRMQGRDGFGERLSGVASSASSDNQSSLSDGDWSEGGEDDGNESQEADYDVDRSERGAAVRHHPEETASGAMAGRRKGRVRGDRGSEGTVDGIGGSEGGDGMAEDVAEEHGLLSRLRSVAQEARLEVMDSRLQDLHVSCWGLGG